MSLGFEFWPYTCAICANHANRLVYNHKWGDIMGYIEIKRITCLDDKDNEYIIIMRQKIISKALGGIVQKNKGHIDFILADGTHVNMIGDDYKTFELLDVNRTQLKAI